MTDQAVTDTLPPELCARLRSMYDQCALAGCNEAHPCSVCCGMRDFVTNLAHERDEALRDAKALAGYLKAERDERRELEAILRRNPPTGDIDYAGTIAALRAALARAEAKCINLTKDCWDTETRAAELRAIAEELAQMPRSEMGSTPSLLAVEALIERARAAVSSRSEGSANGAIEGEPDADER